MDVSVDNAMGSKWPIRALQFIIRRIDGRATPRVIRAGVYYGQVVTGPPGRKRSQPSHPIFSNRVQRGRNRVCQEQVPDSLKSPREKVVGRQGLEP